MDVLILLDKLDDLIYSSKQIPLTDQVRVEREEAYSLLDQIRVTLPEEIKQARWIVKEREEQAKSESPAQPDEDRHLQEIQNSIEELKRSQRPAPPPLTAAAAEKVRSIIEAAEASAAQVRADAERDARGIKSEAARRGMELRKRSAAEAATRLKRADEVTAALLAEAASASAGIDSLLDRVRGPAAMLADVFGEGAAKVEADFGRMRALVAEAPLGEEWQAADPKGEIVARRDGASKSEQEVDPGSDDEVEEELDRSPQSTEEWSYEEAMSGEAGQGDDDGGEAPQEGDEQTSLSTAGPNGRRFERPQAPHSARP
jgi:hypothetical protein